MSRRRFPLVLFLVLALVYVAPDATSQPTYEWKKLCDLSIARHGFAVAKIAEDKILITGGFKNSSGQLHGEGAKDCEVINVTTGVSEAFPPMNDGRTEHIMLTRADGIIYVLGGRRENSESGSNSIEAYDPTTRTWKRVGSLRAGRRQLAGLFIDDHRILTVGGRLDASNVVGNAEIFDTRTGLSESVAPYPMGISTGCAAIIEGKPCVFAGRAGGVNSDRSREVWAFEGGGWRLLTRLQETVVAPTLVELPSGDIAVTGGALMESPFNASTAIQTLTNSSPARVVGNIKTGRQWHGAALWKNDHIVIVGGYQRNVVIASSAEAINLTNGSVMALPSLPEARAYVQLVSSEVQPGGVRSPTVIAISGLTGSGSGSMNTPSVYYLTESCSQPTQNLLDSKQFRLVGMAAVTNEGVRITPSTGTAVGRMSSNVPLDGSSFDISVGLKLSRGTDNGYLDGGPQGADGIAMLFSTGIDRTYLGRNGEGLGYDGLPNVVVVEVDAYRNPANFDRDPQHVALMVPVQGVTSSRHDDKNTVAMKQLPFELTADGSVYDFRVSYDGSRLNVFASSAATGTQLVLSVPDFDIFERLGVARSTPLYASITSATGKSMQEHTIVRWNLEGCGAITSVDDDEDVNVRTGDNHESVLSFDATSREIVVAQALTSDIVVYDLTGNVVLRHGPSQIGQRVDVSLLPRGFYVASSGTTSISFIVHE